MRLLPAFALALLLAACGTGPGTPEGQGPVTLSYLRADEPPSQPLRDLAGASRRAYLRAQIFMPGWQGQGRGSGIVNAASATLIDRSGLAVTPAHIALGTNYEAAILDSEGRKHKAEILDVAPGQELALLRFDPPETEGVPPPAFAPPPFAPEDSLSPGDPLFAIGTPDNKAGVVAQGRVAEPRTSRRIFYGEYGFDNAIVVAMDAVPGFSGGPLFDMQGRLVGIVASFDLNPRPSRHLPPGRTYAIPVADVLDYVETTRPR